MIGETRSDLDPEQSKEKIALRDAIVTFLFVLIANLAAYGYPPTMQALYASILAALLIGITSYMHSMNIKKPQPNA